MLKDREKLYQAYHTVLSMALTWAFVLVLNQYFTLRVPMVLSAVFSFIPVILINIFNLNRKNIISYIVIGCTIPIFALVLWLTKTNLIRWMSDFIYWCTSYNGSKLLYKSYYANFIMLLVAIVGAILFYLLMKKEVTKICLAVIIISTLVILSIGKINVSKTVVGICIFYILTVLVELYGLIYSKRVGRQDKKEGILYLAPICLILAIVAISLPSKPEPIRWTFVKNTYLSIKEKLEQWQLDWNYNFGNGSEFFSLSGFSGEEKLGNGKELITSDKVNLKASGLSEGTKVYLIGAISDIYTGDSWEKSTDNYVQGEKDYNLDYLEFFYALSRQDEKILENYPFINKSRIILTYDNIKTKSVFFPLKTGRISANNNYQFQDEAPQILFSQRNGKGTSYDIDYIDLNLEGKAFKQMLREADKFTYGNAPLVSAKKVKLLEKYTLTSGRCFDPVAMESNYQKLKEREKIIYEKYVQLPQELPDRVKQLAIKITADYDNNYDKLKALETYLKKYTYSLKTDKVPEGQDFVDFFLFDGQKGYCTSFATAMAVMGRCIGVPTRYVEGFSAQMNEMNKDKYIIRSNRAHAWAEAYIKGVGWIPFEATAPYSDNRYTKWSDRVTNSDSTGNNSSNNNNHPQVTNQPEKVTPVKQGQKDNNGVLKLCIIFVAVVFSLLLTILIYYNLLRLRYKSEFKKADYSKKMYMQFLRILRLLCKMGFVLEQQETIQMLANRVKEHYKYDQVVFQDIANIYMRYRYAQTAVTEHECKRVKQFHDGIYNQYKKGEKQYRIWIEEFAFLAMRNKQY